jgi:hypothetical protein
MRITEKIPDSAGHCPLLPKLTGLDSGMATKVGLGVALDFAADSPGESAA